MPLMVRVTKGMVVVGSIGAVIGVVALFLFGQASSRLNKRQASEIAHTVLSSGFGIELSNSWLVVEASGGLTGFPLVSFRRQEEVYVLLEGSRPSGEALANELSGKKHVRFLPKGYASGVEPHPGSGALVPWWQPDKISEPMRPAKSPVPCHHRCGRHEIRSLNLAAGRK
jgi:hypothetical protein